MDLAFVPATRRALADIHYNDIHLNENTHRNTVITNTDSVIANSTTANSTTANRSTVNSTIVNSTTVNCTTVNSTTAANYNNVAAANNITTNDINATTATTATIVPADQATSSGDDTPSPPDERGNDVQAAIGVSIGREQTRLMSPSTPAAQKIAAIRKAGGYFDGAFDDTPPIAESPDGAESPHHHLRPPSPWRSWTRQSNEREKERSLRTRSVLRDGFSFGRRRASSGPENPLSKSLFSSLPSYMTTPFSSTRDLDKGEGRELRKRTSPNLPKQRLPPHDSRSPLAIGAESSKQWEEAKASSGKSQTGSQPPSLRTRPPGILRRSTSDTSLVTQRTLSRVSSLGDDSRFEDISEQVNSRFKAIKDSLQDTKIGLRSMPSISSFNVSSFTPDFLSREWSNSSLTKYGSRLSTMHSTPAEKHVDVVDPMTRQPYTSARQALTDASMDKAADHPHFNKALQWLEGDVVVLGGYRGSILRSAEPPHRQLWVPIKVGLNLRKVDLEVGLGEDGDERAKEKVIPGGMLTHIGPVDISRRLLKRLRSSENARSGKLRVHEYGYDWRLHPTYLSKQLVSFLEGLPSNQPGTPKDQRGAIVIAHSLGGLITRHAVNHRPELFGGVVYAGVPETCVNILGPLRNGDEVLLSSRVLTAQVNFTIRTSFALLPLDGRCFIDKFTKEEYPVDFFDPQTWIEYRLSPCVARPLPPLSAPPKPTGIAGYVTSVANALPSLPMPGRKGSKSAADIKNIVNAGGTAAPETLHSGAQSNDVAVANGNIHYGPEESFGADALSARTAVTISREEAIAYLTRTLATVKEFKQDLAHVPAHEAANVYPPLAVIYGKSTPTLLGAKVDGREGIKHADAYDELAFASGDGVVLARAAMVPDGYRTAKGGVVSSIRGHVTLLGDLEAVGKCLYAVIRARRRGVGKGIPP